MNNENLYDEIEIQERKTELGSTFRYRKNYLCGGTFRNFLSIVFFIQRRLFLDYTTDG